MSVAQPQRKTKLIITEIPNKDNPQKPSVIETSTTEVQMTSKEGLMDQKEQLNASAPEDAEVEGRFSNPRDKSSKG